MPAGFEDYTAVSTKEELAGLANQAGKYVLTSDIDLSGEAWTSIANFSGTLDGNFHKITGLTGGDNCNGLFGESNGQFKNIIIDGAVLRAKVDRTGALAGSLTGGASVEGCAVVNSEIYGQHQIGGLAGTTNNVSYIKNSFVANTTVGKDGGGFYVGGLVGELWFTVMENCYFNGTLNGGGARSVGGITGDSMEADRIIANCYAAGKIVNVSERVGGIIGDYDQPKWYGAKISNCVSLFESMPNVPSSGRIVSAIPAEIGDWAPSLSGNKALGSMGLSSVTDDAAGKDGATITFSEATDFSTYTGFSQDVWAMGGGKL